mgnify:CR=1 FL=1
MRIDADKIVEFDLSSDEQYQLLLAIENDNVEKQIISLDELLNADHVNWDTIKYYAKQSPARFEELLFRIHFKRKNCFTEVQESRVLQFLVIVYIFAGDVRYFNEFLYFDSDGKSHYWRIMLKTFFDNLGEDYRHTFNANNDEIESYIEKSIRFADEASNKETDVSLQIGLLGSPTFFKRLRKKLLTKGFNVSCYFVPYHPNKRINFILKNRFLFKLICLVYNINFGFQRLSSDYKDPKTEEVLKNKQLDIGYHKLGFIIKKNIINPFSIGIINDHWGVLPYIRGRSTIEYSVLLGVPLVATTHVVCEGVDSGDIINMYRYEELVAKCASVEQIRNHIRDKRDERALDSILLLAKNKAPMTENSAEKGVMFYSMHSYLVEFINTAILKMHIS